MPCSVPPACASAARRRVAASLAATAVVLTATPARAHTATTLFNWTRQVRFLLAPGNLTLHYSLAAGDVLGKELRAEIDANRDGVVSGDEKQRYLERVAALVEPRLALEVDGAAVQVRFSQREQLIPGDDIGVRPINLELYLDVPLTAGVPGQHALRYRDRSTLPRLADNSILIAELGGCRLLASGVDGAEPSVERQYAFAEPEPGIGYVVEVRWDASWPPDESDGPGGPEGSAVGAARGPGIQPPAEQGRMAALVSREELSPGFILLALGVALLLGALHAFSPGHGKTVVAAYLVGSHGTLWHAVLLGLTVTFTHVVSVVILGVLTLGLSAYVMPDHILPWLGFVSGMLVVAVGVWMLVVRVRAARSRQGTRGVGGSDPGHAHAHAHAHAPVHVHAQAPAHAHAHEPDHAHVHAHDPDPDPDDDHHHGHTHVPRSRDGSPVTLIQLLTLGVTGGLVPCPSALVVLLTAIALHRILFGLALIGSFSAGLALVLILIGVVMIKARGLLDRVTRFDVLARRLPIASAAVVTVLGLVIAVRALAEGNVLSLVGGR